MCLVQGRIQSRPVTSCPLRPSPFVLGRRTMDYRIQGRSWPDTRDPVPSCPLRRPLLCWVGRRWTIKFRAVLGRIHRIPSRPIPCDRPPLCWVGRRWTIKFMAVLGRNHRIPSRPMRPSPCVLGTRMMDHRIKSHPDHRIQVRFWLDSPIPVRRPVPYLCVGYNVRG